MTISNKWSLPLLLFASALIYFLTIGTALSVIVPSVSCSTLEEAIKTADQAVTGVYNIADTCEIRPIQVPDNPSDVVPVYLTKNGKPIYIVVEAIHQDGIRYSVLHLVVEMKGQAI